MPQTRVQVQPDCVCICCFLIVLSILSGSVKGGCSGAGKVGGGECEEQMMDSESNARVLLMHRRYISYATLLRDLVPCDRPGASYYNCRGGPAAAVANSYNRGCEIITRCARGY